MAGRKLAASDIPSPGPWLVRGKAGEGASPVDQAYGVEPATNEGPGGWPYLIRQDRTFAVGQTPLHLATGIQRLADARLMAAAPELAEALFRLLLAPDLLTDSLEPATRAAVDVAWPLLVRVAPHFEI